MYTANAKEIQSQKVFITGVLNTWTKCNKILDDASKMKHYDEFSTSYEGKQTMN